MNEKEINTACTKALGWTLRKHKTESWMIWVDSNDKPIEYEVIFNYHNTGRYYVMEDDLRFTISRDWAWLLVDEVRKRGLIISFVMILTGLNKASTKLILEIFKKSPKQITLAALEVLK